MQLGFRLLEDNINAVRSRIELAKAERDRSFQEFVAVVGAGIGVGWVERKRNPTNTKMLGLITTKLKCCLGRRLGRAKAKPNKYKDVGSHNFDPTYKTTGVTHLK
jgi:hypothetical protein